jgi:hypothetical protein
VRSYNLYADQDRPPGDERRPERDVRIVRGEDGTGQVVATLDDLELEEFAAAFQAFVDLRYRTAACGRVSTGDSPAAPSRNETRAEALMDMVRTALLHADGGQVVADDRYMVHLVTRDNGRTVGFVDGRPLDPSDAATVGCDASTVAHTLREDGEPLRLGRKTRTWSSAQRRAISVRDGGRCRFPGCEFRHYDIHHMRPWEDGGATDIDNGICCCRRHHRLLHRGYRVEGEADRELAFYRPDGSILGMTEAAGRVMAGSGGGLRGAPR